MVYSKLCEFDLLFSPRVCRLLCYFVCPFVVDLLDFLLLFLSIPTASGLIMTDHPDRLSFFPVESIIIFDFFCSFGRILLSLQSAACD